jgi:hypothetical protein
MVADWASGKNPSWWRSYNNVKHQRDSYFPEASLDNCGNAMTALFAIVLYCHTAERSADALEPYPVLLGRDQEPGHLLLESGYSVPAVT